MNNLIGKVAVITGGGSGLGRELSLCCAQRGMKLVLADVDASGMAETERLVKKKHPGVETVCKSLDVSQLDQVEALADFVQERFGGTHLLFNNADVGSAGPIWESTASAAGWMNGPGAGIYNVSKCGVVAMSESLVADLKDVGGNIGVSVVSPAFFPTPMLKNAQTLRPQDASEAPLSDIAQKRKEQTHYAMQNGKVSAAQIAEVTLRAVDENRFYVFPHPKIKALVLARATAVQEETTAFDPMATR